MAQRVKEFVKVNVAQPKIGIFELMIIATGILWVLSL